MPGPVSDSSQGPGPRTPYVPSWCYDDEGGPRICVCGCHEGWHNDEGACLNARSFCGCRGSSYTDKRLTPFPGFTPIGAPVTPESLS